jgi:UDP-3-O-[3-hydroxymyristoyl] glucosamine N-acyltransferase
VLYPDVIVGNRVVLHAGVVLGCDGFGYRMVNGRHEWIPHLGTVRIGDDVEIGACSTVDRAMIGETVIGEGSKLDNHVMVGHNCEVGKHNILVSQVGLAGSVTTGDYVVCAGQSGVADHVHLGDGCRLAAKTGAHKDLPGHQTYIGTPAAPEAEARRIVMAQQRLPELRKHLRDLEKQVSEISARVRALEAPGRGELRAA